MSVKVTVGQQTFIKKIVLGTPITTARETLSIDEFTDFDVATKSDAQILVFDSSEGVFKNFTFDVGQGLAREYSPADDKLIIGIDSDKTPVVTGILSKGNLTPTLDSAFDLGDSARKWRNLHLSGKTIFLGGLKVKDSGGDFAVKDSNEQPVNFDLSGSAIFNSDYNTKTADADINFGSSGVITTVAGGNGPGRNLNQLQGASDLHVDSNGNIYVINGGSGLVTKWEKGASQGEIVVDLGYAPGDYSSIFVDSSENIYIAETNGHKVTKWTPNATQGVVVAGTVRGSALNQLNDPILIQMD